MKTSKDILYSLKYNKLTEIFHCTEKIIIEDWNNITDSKLLLRYNVGNRIIIGGTKDNEGNIIYF